MKKISYLRYWSGVFVFHFKHVLYCCRSKYADVEWKFHRHFLYPKEKQTPIAVAFSVPFSTIYITKQNKFKRNKTELKESGSRRERSFPQSGKEASI